MISISTASVVSIARELTQQSVASHSRGHASFPGEGLRSPDALLAATKLIDADGICGGQHQRQNVSQEKSGHTWTELVQETAFCWRRSKQQVDQAGIVLKNQRAKLETCFGYQRFDYDPRPGREEDYRGPLLATVGNSKGLVTMRDW